jgi:hypothetical protein
MRQKTDLIAPGLVSESESEAPKSPEDRLLEILEQ